MNYNLKAIPIIPQAKELIDIVLSKTQRKTPTEVHPQFQISRIRKFYMRKVKFCQSTIEEKLDDMLDKFPKLDEIHPFYADLMNVLYDRDHYKLALGHLNKAKTLIETVSKDYVRMLKYADSLYRAKILKKAALGRMCTILKKLASSLNYLEEVRKHMARLPSIDPHTRTIILTGYPNVGKSSFMNNVTNANVEVQPYAFTTKSLFVGHTEFELMPWQVIDTPGLLDRPLEERNIIEMQAITAMAHLNACILFFIDISEKCGYTIPQQLELFNSVRPLYANKPLGIVISKIDVKPFESLDPVMQQTIYQLAQQFNAFISFVSNESKDGVIDCRNRACETLREFRQQIKTKKGVAYAPNQPYIAMPKTSVSRPPIIPQSVMQEKFSGEKLRSGPTVKDIQEEQGGAGVFSIPLQEHFVDLEKEEWRYDIMPEMMDGKNILDFVDPDILEKLEELEKEEEMLKDAHVPLDIDEYRTVSKVKQKIFQRRLRLQKEGAFMKEGFRPNRMELGELEDGLEKLGVDTSKIAERVGKKRGRDTSMDIDNSEYPEDLMDIDEGEARPDQMRKKIKLKSSEFIKERRKGKSVKPTGKEEYRWLPQGRNGIADTKMVNEKPRHLLTGKRGIGKTDRR